MDSQDVLPGAATPEAIPDGDDDTDVNLPTESQESQDLPGIPDFENMHLPDQESFVQLLEKYTPYAHKRRLLGSFAPRASTWKAVETWSANMRLEKQSREYLDNAIKHAPPRRSKDFEAFKGIAKDWGLPPHMTTNISGNTLRLKLLTATALIHNRRA